MDGSRMNSNLLKQQEAFKRTLQRQPEIQRPSSATTSTASSSRRPLNSYVHAIITFLKNSDRPATFDEIRLKLNLDLHTIPELLDKVCRNERIICENSTLSYRPPFNLRSKNDIIPMLESQPSRTGVELAEIKDSFAKVEEALAELARNREIFVVRFKEEGPRIIFRNDYKIERTIDEEFRDLWSSVPVPADEFELSNALRKAGLRVAAAQPTKAPPASAQSKRKAPKRPFRRIKITNDYLEGIDLSLDPNTHQ